MLKVALILTVFNRKDMTLECLRRCVTQFEAIKAEGEFQFSIHMTDDGSTDRTSEAVLKEIPGVEIIKGEGDLFWNRGMIAAWKKAAEQNPDFYLWINNDTMIEPGAIATMLETSKYLKHNAIVTGTAVDSKGRLSYGGRTKKGKIIEPDAEIPVPCDVFNGNLVLIPKAVYEKLGTLDPHYSHSFGDFDYGVRALKAGITSVIAPGTLARCNRNPGIPKWRNAAVSLRERYRALQSPKGRPIDEQFLYDSRRSGIIYAVCHFITLNARVIFPVKE